MVEAPHAGQWLESYVVIHRLRIRAFHGVLPQERLTGNDYEVNVRIGYPLAAAMTSDDVADTLNYASLCEVIKREMRQPANLLEHVAARIIAAIQATWQHVTSIDLELTKLNPPISADCDGASVELHVNKEI